MKTSKALPCDNSHRGQTVKPRAPDSALSHIDNCIFPYKSNVNIMHSVLSHLEHSVIKVCNTN